MQDAKEEVRARLNIEDVIGEYVQLKRAGRNFKGLSPFSGEKTPSFFVSPDKHIWHDFSSNKGGDVFSFVMEAEGMDFRQALEHLARKAGVDLSEYESKGSHNRRPLRASLRFQANPSRRPTFPLPRRSHPRRSILSTTSTKSRRHQPRAVCLVTACSSRSPAAVSSL